MLGISRAKREAMVRDGLLPKPYKLGRRAVGFRSDEIEVAMANFARIEDAYERSGRRSVGEVIMRRTKFPKKEGGYGK
jgi:hypothetical protein